uniref:Cryptic/Cripto CFC domain-containing protein n=1 Tax=Piliocolobus tephrosceles TaxID=591936 RepID=A0A8C9HPT8_9PRIM
MAISKAFELELGGQVGPPYLACLCQGDLAFKGTALSPRRSLQFVLVSQFVPSMGIKDSKERNRTCCLNGGTCTLGCFRVCPSSYGWNCDLVVCRESCESVHHDTWLPKKCSMCKCWHGQPHSFPEAFLPGCDGLVMDEDLMAPRTLEYYHLHVPLLC